MTASVHGHEILNHLGQQPMAEHTLIAWANAQWGETVRFHTCSQQGLTLSELLDFLRRRQKVVEENGVLTVNLSRVCNH